VGGWISYISLTFPTFPFFDHYFWVLSPSPPPVVPPTFFARVSAGSPLPFKNKPGWACHTCGFAARGPPPATALTAARWRCRGCSSRTSSNARRTASFSYHDSERVVASGVCVIFTVIKFLNTHKYLKHISRVSKPLIATSCEHVNISKCTDRRFSSCFIMPPKTSSWSVMPASGHPHSKVGAWGNQTTPSVIHFVPIFNCINFPFYRYFILILIYPPFL